MTKASPSLHTSSQCTHAQHESAQQRLCAIADACEQRHLRFTPLRRQVLELILTAKKPLGAYEILAKLQQIQTAKPPVTGKQVLEQKAIAPPTVYRSLDFLLEHGFIHQLSSTNAFIPCCHPQKSHVAVFLICQKCGEVEELSASSITSMLSPIIEQSKFAIQSSVLEISGFCLHCQQNLATK